tara:strand:- start:15233 stop:16354 length:1122 start_codon:yes stop_codon:yes gene_type:complete
MKIALFTNGIFPYVIGGIQKHSYYLIKYLAKINVYVDAYHFKNSESELDHIFSKEELVYINLLEFSFPKSIKFPGHYIFKNYILSKEYYKVAIKKNYDLIYCQGFTSWYFLKKHPFQKNLITNLHGLNMFQNSVNFRNKLEQILLKIPAKKIIRNSYKQISLGGKLTNLLYDNGAMKKSVVEVPNGIDSSWYINPEDLKEKNNDMKLKLIFIGRYDRTKGVEELNDVINNTIEKLSYQIDFIGPIPLDKQIKNKNIHYFGLVNDTNFIRNKIREADILICPSHSEGMPTVILEAMAGGCAIIATDVGAINLMVNFENGWLIKGDIREGLEKYIKEALLLSSKELLELKKNSLNKIIDKFSWEEIIKNTVKIVN